MSDYMLVHANRNITSMFLTMISDCNGVSIVKKLVNTNFCTPKLISILKIKKNQALKLLILFKINSLTVFDPKHIIAAFRDKFGIVRGNDDRSTSGS